MSEARPRGLSEDLTWAIRLARSGYDRDRIATTLGRKHHRIGYESLTFGELVLARGFEPARRYALRTATKALEIAQREGRIMDANAALARLHELYAQVDAEPWPLELAGPRRALEAAYLVAVERRRVAEFRLDLRTHAMRAGQTFAAIRRHRVILHDLGWLRRNPRDRWGRTSRLSFSVPRTHLKTLGSHEMCAGVLLAHDAWRNLGDDTWYVWRIVQSGAPRREVIRCVGREVLERLSAAGLSQPLSQEDALERLDLWALRDEVATFNTGYREGMKFLSERARRLKSLDVRERVAS